MHVSRKAYMATFIEILRPILIDIESLIKNYLSDPFNLTYYNNYMPLKINLITQNDQCTITFLSDGKIIIDHEISMFPDIIINGDDTTLKLILQNRDNKLFREAEEKELIKITPKTSKGEKFTLLVRIILGMF